MKRGKFKVYTNIIIILYGFCTTALVIFNVITHYYDSPGINSITNIVFIPCFVYFSFQFLVFVILCFGTYTLYSLGSHLVSVPVIPTKIYTYTKYYISYKS